MTDRDRDSLDLQDEDRLPWLEAVDDADEEEGVSLVRLIVLVLAGLVFLGAIIGGIYWLQSVQRGEGAPTLIAAPSGDYKVRAENPDARKFQGEGDTSFAASAGKEEDGRIDASRLPETPLAKAPAPAAPAVKSVAASKPAPKVEATVADRTGAAPPSPARAVAEDSPGGGSPMIQLGAYNSRSLAESAWKSLCNRFDYLEGLDRSVTEANVNGATYYRLRLKVASRAQGNALCGKLKIAGESCIPVAGQ